MFFKEEYIENYDFSLNKFTLVNIVDNYLENHLKQKREKECTKHRNDKRISCLYRLCKY